MCRLVAVVHLLYSFLIILLCTSNTESGKLEYDRKVEEEGRWRSYTEEAESILNNVQVGIIHNDIKDGTNPIDERKGNTETSVLKAAISRRIEEGIISLRSYIHPYNYLKHRDEGRIGTNSQSEA